MWPVLHPNSTPFARKPLIDTWVEICQDVGSNLAVDVPAQQILKRSHWGWYSRCVAVYHFNNIIFISCAGLYSSSVYGSMISIVPNSLWLIYLWITIFSLCDILCYSKKINGLTWSCCKSSFCFPKWSWWVVSQRYYYWWFWSLP